MSETATIAAISASAALVAAIVTACAALGVAYKQSRWAAKAAEEEAFFTAAEVVLTKGLTMIERARLWSGLLQAYSRVSGGMALLLRLRPTVDPVAVLSPLILDQEQLSMAGARVCLLADQETVRLCNRVMDAARDLAHASMPPSAKGSADRLFRQVKGLPAADQAVVQRAAESLIVARGEFAIHLRQLRSKAVVDVYARGNAS